MSILRNPANERDAIIFASVRPEGETQKEAAKSPHTNNAMAMDARTIAKILKDEETMKLELEASKHRLQLEAQSRLQNYFQLIRSEESSADNTEKTQQITAHYQAKLDELAVRYLAVSGELNASFEAKKIAAKLRYEQAMVVANKKTAIAFKENYDTELQLAAGVFHTLTEEKSQLNNAAIAEIKAAKARELESLPTTQTISRSLLSDDESLKDFQHNLLCDTENMGAPFLLSYKAGSNEEVALYSLKQPQTPNDFYELAMAIKMGKNRFQGGYFDVYYYGERAEPGVLKWFMYNILSDAAKAGHLFAKNELIEATIKGDPEARKHVTLKEFNGIRGMSIKLPRKFSSTEELRKLGSDLLIQHRKGHCVDGKPLIGPYYELVNAKYAENLGKGLIKFSEERRKLEAEENAKRAYADQSSRVAQNSSAMFTANFVNGERMDAKYPQQPGSRMSIVEETVESPNPGIQHSILG